MTGNIWRNTFNCFECSFWWTFKWYNTSHFRWDIATVNFWQWQFGLIIDSQKLMGAFQGETMTIYQISTQSVQRLGSYRERLHKYKNCSTDNKFDNKIAYVKFSYLTFSRDIILKFYNSHLISFKLNMYIYVPQMIKLLMSNQTFWHLQ